MKNKLLELFTLYFFIPFLFILDIITFEDRFQYFTVLFVFIVIQSYRYRDSIQFQFKVNLKPALMHGIKISLFSIVLIYPFNFFLDIEPFSNSETRYLLFVFITYPLLSSPLQEYFFRTYYYARYKGINRSLLFILNLFAFALIHYMYGGMLAVYFSFISGLIINLNYKSYKNDLAISIIHAFHGMMIFLLGYSDYFTDFFR